MTASLEPLVERNMARHARERHLWMPSDLLPLTGNADADQSRDMREVPDRAGHSGCCACLPDTQPADRGRPAAFPPPARRSHGQQQRLVTMELSLDCGREPSRLCAPRLCQGSPAARHGRVRGLAVSISRGRLRSGLGWPRLCTGLVSMARGITEKWSPSAWRPGVSPIYGPTAQWAVRCRSG